MRATGCWFAEIVSSGCASNCSSSEIATPIRVRPKSKARMRFISLSFRAKSRNPVAKPIGWTAGSFDFAQDDRPSLSLQFRRKFADQVFDSFRFAPVTNQKSIWRTNDDQIMHAE